MGELNHYNDYLSWDSQQISSSVRRREVISPSDIYSSNTSVDDTSPDDDVQQYIGLGCDLTSIITENLLIHPFLVLKRQCQVNPISKKYHLLPSTLIPVILQLHQTQGLSRLWKGIGSVLVVRGMTLAVEDMVSKVTPWPKEINHVSFKTIGQHIILKCVSIGIVTPFYSASLVETVQSAVASEKPGVFDVFRDGLKRLLEVRNKGRLIPIYALLPPTIACGVLKYLFAFSVKVITNRIMKIRHKCTQESQGAYSRDLSKSAEQDIEIHSLLISMCTADIVFYPFETVIQRLHLQGTRTIIDNLDTGRNVTAMLTGYSGAVNCYHTIISTEGPLGLYKGFGALIIQFAIHALVLKATKCILTEISSLLQSKQKSSKPSLTYCYNEI